MRKLMMAVAATAVLASAALFTDTRPANAQSVSQEALKTAFETGDLQVSYVQRAAAAVVAGLLIAAAAGAGLWLIVAPAVAALWPIAARAAEVLSPIAGVMAARVWPPGYGPGYRPGYRPVLSAAAIMAIGTTAGTAMAARHLGSRPVLSSAAPSRSSRFMQHPLMGATRWPIAHSAINPTIPAAVPFWAMTA